MNGKKIERRYYDTVVCGGGVAGVCAAVAAARHGLKTVLVQNRSVLGGNGSSEMTININGASYDGNSPSVYAGETGILQELKLMIAYYGSRDIAFFELVYKEKNLTLLLETQAVGVQMGGGRIEAVKARGLMDEREYALYGDIFIDCTGDGTIGAMAGVPYMQGREAAGQFGESLAPVKADRTTMGHSILLFAEDAGEKVEFHRPEFAYDITKTEFYKDMMKPGSIRRIPDYRGGRYCGFWWVEYGGQVDTIGDHGEITLELRKIIYGIWDYIKNSGMFKNVGQLRLAYVTPIAGKRESRRFKGDYIFTQNDIDQKRSYDDSVCTGGWAMDIHAPQGIYDPEPATIWHYVGGMYEMPFSMMYTPELDNFMFAGRNMSASHVAFGSVRVQATGGVAGQAVGTAAYLCRKYGVSPQDVRQRHMKELQALLLKDDQTILGRRYTGSETVEKKVRITAKKRPYENAEAEGTLSLERTYMLVLPVDHKRMEAIKIGVRNRSGATQLHVKLYQGRRPENYIPEICAGEFYKEIPQGYDGWITLEPNIECGSDQKVYLEFCENAQLELYARNQDVPGAVTFLKGGELPSTSDYSSAYQYRKIPHSQPMLKNICFKDIKPEMTGIYDANCLIDGMSRPYGVPELWSAPMGEPLVFTYAEPVYIDRMELVFDTALERDFCEEEMPPVLLKDYDLVITGTDGEETVSVRQNFKRVRIHPIGRRVTKIQVQPKAAYGSEFANIFAVRFFDKENANEV